MASRIRVTLRRPHRTLAAHMDNGELEKLKSLISNVFIYSAVKELGGAKYVSRPDTRVGGKTGLESRAIAADKSVLNSSVI